jgi:hypothetical protein
VTTAEYSETAGLNDFMSYDGLGMVGETAQSVTTRSARTWPSGKRQALLHKTTYSGTCADTQPTTKTLSSARRVYRPANAPPPPAGYGSGLVVSSTNHANSYCL